MAWGIDAQQNLYGMDWETINRLGSKLSIELSCPIRYPAYNKRLFECKCGIVFPVYVVQQEDWEGMKEKHKGGSNE